MYKCKCGREFEKRQSYVAHCGHCKINLGREPVDTFGDSRAWRRGKTKETDSRLSSSRRIDLNDVFSGKKYMQTNRLKWRLIEEGFKDLRCERCGLSKWLDVDIPIELHHIDGNRDNNSLENLQILCPNCHSFTDTYRWRKKFRSTDLPED